MKTYLGDSVYVDTFGSEGNIVLTTENGSGVPFNKIFLEPSVVQDLLEYLKVGKK